jgi:hypothetical protein
MLECPHCQGPITTAELRSERLLRPRVCRNCRGEYIEGGTEFAFAAVAVAGAVATSMGKDPALPDWSPWLVLAFGGAVAVWCTTVSQPRKREELRRRLLQILGIVPMTAIGVWSLLRAFA